MKFTFRHRMLVVGLFLGVVAALAGGVWRVSYLQALNQLSLQGQADLALASDRLVGQLQRYRELAVFLAGHPLVADLAEVPADKASEKVAEADALFLSIADKSAALDVMYVGRDGRVRAAVQARTGSDLSQTGYVGRALQGALGWGQGIDTPLDARAYYHAAPVFGRDGQVEGSVIVAAGIARIEDAWRGGLRAVFFTDDTGQVFITNRSELIFWRRAPVGPGLIPPGGVELPFDSYETGGHEVWQMGWGPYLPVDALHIAQPLPVIGMTGEVLLDVAPARRIARLQAAIVAALCLAFGALLFLATERRRTLARANIDLEERVARRTAALQDINNALRAEAAERAQAQRALRQAQADLVQAGKLSALGQMSAGISHELNQPLMAIRSFAENAVQFLDRGAPDRAAENLTRISDMARRMGRIIKNLRAFSKQAAEPATRVDLVTVIDNAMEMIAARAANLEVEIVFDRPGQPIWVQGGEVRLGQVFVNLMTNALDAMAQSPERTLSIEINLSEVATIEVRDTGPGIADPQKVFDPFYSTKEVGASEGMGLGLSISYGIVQSFGGDIRVRNCNPGALFIVEIKPWEVSQAA